MPRWGRSAPARSLPFIAEFGITKKP